MVEGRVSAGEATGVYGGFDGHRGEAERSTVVSFDHGRALSTPPVHAGDFVSFSFFFDTYLDGQ